MPALPYRLIAGPDLRAALAAIVQGQNYRTALVLSVSVAFSNAGLRFAGAEQPDID